MATHKLCPACDERLPAECFYDEPNDTITGLSMLCKECLGKKKKSPKRRSYKGWHTISPSGLKGKVTGMRTETNEIVIHFEGTRTAVLPMEKTDAE